MSPTQTRIVIVAFAFLLIFLSGYWLSRLGKPYPTLVVTLHKLIAIGAAVFLGMTIYRMNQAVPLAAVQWMALAATILFALITVITGGLASVEKTFPPLVARAHHFGPYFTTLSCAVFLFLAAR